MAKTDRTYKKIEQVIICLIIIFGIYLRVNQYLQNRNLWLDECFFAFSVFDNDLFNNLQLQKYNQLSPLGFVFIEKFIVSLFGHSEYALRFFPLICGIASILLFYRLLKYFYSGIALIIPLSLFSFSSQLIYFSSEAKQYSSDVLITILLVLTGLKLQDKNTNNTLKNLILYSSVFYIFFSLTSVFTLSAITIYFLTKYFILNRKLLVKENVIFSIGWISGFIVYLNYNYDTHIRNTPLHNFWQSGYISEKTSALTILKEAFNYIELKDFNFDFCIFIIGVISILLRKKILGLYLITPLILLIISSFLKLYPASGRLILFSIPIVFLIIGECIDFITSSKISAIKTWGSSLALIFLLLQADTYVNDLKMNITKENIKYCLNYINKNKKPNDVIYLQHFSQYGFKYYAKDYGFNDDFTPISNWSHPIIKKDFFSYQRWYIKPKYNKIFISKSSKHTTMNRRKIDYELKMLKGSKRVWVLFSHDALYYSKKFKSHLNRYGKQLDFIAVPGREGADSHLYLYDFSKKENTSKKKEDKDKDKNKIKCFINNLFKDKQR